jgi:organic radical activating enzyme
MYTKKIKKDFSEVELTSIQSNISKLKHFIDTSTQNLQIMSFTGGEPAMFPDIVRIFYESFDDKLIRICTN